MRDKLKQCGLLSYKQTEYDDEATIGKPMILQTHMVLFLMLWHHRPVPLMKPICMDCRYDWLHINSRFRACMCAPYRRRTPRAKRVGTGRTRARRGAESRAVPVPSERWTHSLGRINTLARCVGARGPEIYVQCASYQRHGREICAADRSISPLSTNCVCATACPSILMISFSVAAGKKLKRLTNIGEPRSQVA
jgi:hypothetical protein